MYVHEILMRKRAWSDTADMKIAQLQYVGNRFQRAMP